MIDRRIELEADLESLYVERGEVKARRDLILRERGYNDDEFVELDDELYIIERAIDELEWKLYIMNGGH